MRSAENTPASVVRRRSPSGSERSTVRGSDITPGRREKYWEDRPDTSRRYPWAVAPHVIRIIGDPVLKQRASEVERVDGAFARLVEDMFVTMYEAPGVGLAAPQVGVQQRFFVYDHDDDPGVIINPTIVESRGEAAFVEGCLSVPGLHWEIIRPAEIHVKGFDLDGNELDLELDDFACRVFQHEIDHLDGVLLIEHLTDEQRAEARRALSDLRMRRLAPPEPDLAPGRLRII
ncbi:MAG: peptide deformylase [Acidobacteria bacterium]|nr:peptide deformylase [Acidobacteriota bacterium]